MYKANTALRGTDDFVGNAITVGVAGSPLFPVIIAQGSRLSTIRRNSSSVLSTLFVCFGKTYRDWECWSGDKPTCWKKNGNLTPPRSPPLRQISRYEIG
jgi:hypothetical protein